MILNCDGLFIDVEKSEIYKAECHFLQIGEIITNVMKERDRYKKALEEIKKGRVDWTVKERLTMSRGEIFQEIAKEALGDE